MKRRARGARRVVVEKCIVRVVRLPGVCCYVPVKGCKDWMAGGETVWVGLARIGPALSEGQMFLGDGSRVFVWSTGTSASGNEWTSVVESR